jgi:hypothetical protein
MIAITIMKRNEYQKISSFRWQNRSISRRKIERPQGIENILGMISIAEIDLLHKFDLTK